MVAEQYGEATMNPENGFLLQYLWKMLQADQILDILTGSRVEPS